MQRESALIHCGDVLAVLRTMESASVHCVVTSPPYYGLRSYGTPPQVWGGLQDCAHEWGDLLPPKPGPGNKPGDYSTSSLTNPERQDELPRASDSGCVCAACGAWRGDLGQEPLHDCLAWARNAPACPTCYVCHIRTVFAEVRRVLREDGTCWVNLGDSFATDGGHADTACNDRRGQYNIGNRPEHNRRDFRSRPACGIKAKDLMMVPARVALALQSDGWWLRSDIVWHKPDPMPESVLDRPTKAHEYVFLLAKSDRYYYDRDAILEPFATDPRENYPARARITGRGDQEYAAERGNDRGKSGGFPPRGRPSGNKERKLGDGTNGRMNTHLGYGVPWDGNEPGRNKRSIWTIATQAYSGAHFATMPDALVEPCILAGCREGGLVLDPFAGSGTVGVVALRHGRRFVGIELNRRYCRMARERIDGVAPLFLEPPEITPDPQIEMFERPAEPPAPISRYDETRPCAGWHQGTRAQTAPEASAPRDRRSSRAKEKAGNT